MKYPAYSEYKDSDAAFTGPVPSHWSVKRLKFVFPRLLSGVSVNSDNTPSVDEAVAILKTSCVYGNRFDPEENKRVIDTEIDRVACPVTADSLIISRMNTPELVGNCGYVEKDYHYLFLPDRLWIARFSDHVDTDGKFAWYLVTSRAVASLTGVLATGASDSMKNLTQEDFLNIRVGLPPISEQQQIAAFLDWKTGQIDTLIAKKQELVEKLKEKRLAVITQAVTRGLDPASIYKASGLPWCGDIPEHWDTRRLRDISDFVTVGVVVNPSSYFSDEGVPFLLGGNVREMTIDSENCKRCTAESSDGPLIKSRLETNDLVVVRVGYPGVAAVVNADMAGGNVASMMLVRHHRRFSSQWLAYIMNSKIGRDQVEIVQYGAAQKQFNISHAVDFSYPFPPLEEQQEIAEYLNVQTRKFDSLVSVTLNAITRLTEYRSALITAATAGKLTCATSRFLRRKPHPTSL